MTDFKIVDVPGMLAVQSTISDDKENWFPDPDWNREAAESQFVLAEVLVEKSLLKPSAPSVDRRHDLVIYWSDLNEMGQEFVRHAYGKWMRSIDRTGMSEQDKRSKLLKRWQKFFASRTHA